MHINGIKRTESFGLETKFVQPKIIYGTGMGMLPENGSTH